MIKLVSKVFLYVSFLSFFSIDIYSLDISFEDALSREYNGDCEFDNVSEKESEKKSSLGNISLMASSQEYNGMTPDRDSKDVDCSFEKIAVDHFPLDFGEADSDDDIILIDKKKVRNFQYADYREDFKYIAENDIFSMDLEWIVKGIRWFVKKKKKRNHSELTLSHQQKKVCDIKNLIPFKNVVLKKRREDEKRKTQIRNKSRQEKSALLNGLEVQDFSWSNAQLQKKLIPLKGLVSKENFNLIRDLKFKVSLFADKEYGLDKDKKRQKARSFRSVRFDSLDPKVFLLNDSDDDNEEAQPNEKEVINEGVPDKEQSFIWGKECASTIINAGKWIIGKAINQLSTVKKDLEKQKRLKREKKHSEYLEKKNNEKVMNSLEKFLNKRDKTLHKKKCNECSNHNFNKNDKESVSDVPISSSCLRPVDFGINKVKHTNFRAKKGHLPLKTTDRADVKNKPDEVVTVESKSKRAPGKFLRFNLEAKPFENLSNFSDI